MSHQEYSNCEVALGIFISGAVIFIVGSAVLLWPDLRQIELVAGSAAAVVTVGTIAGVALMPKKNNSEKRVIYSSTSLTDEQPEKKPFERELRMKIEEALEKEDRNLR